MHYFPNVCHISLESSVVLCSWRSEALLLIRSSPRIARVAKPNLIDLAANSIWLSRASLASLTLIQQKISSFQLPPATDSGCRKAEVEPAREKNRGSTFAPAVRLAGYKQVNRPLSVRRCCSPWRCWLDRVTPAEHTNVGVTYNLASPGRYKNHGCLLR